MNVKNTTQLLLEYDKNLTKKDHISHIYSYLNISIYNTFEYKVFKNYIDNKEFEKDNIFINNYFYSLIVKVLKNDKDSIISISF